MAEPAGGRPIDGRLKLWQDREVLELMLEQIAARPPGLEDSGLGDPAYAAAFRRHALDEPKSLEAAYLRFTALVSELAERVALVEGFEPAQVEVRPHSLKACDGECAFAIRSFCNDPGFQLNLVFTFRDGLEVDLPLSLRSFPHVPAEQVLDPKKGHLMPYIGNACISICLKDGEDALPVANDAFGFDGSVMQAIDRRGFEQLKPLAAAMVRKAQALYARDGCQFIRLQ